MISNKKALACMAIIAGYFITREYHGGTYTVGLFIGAAITFLLMNDNKKPE